MKDEAVETNNSAEIVDNGNDVMQNLFSLISILLIVAGALITFKYGDAIYFFLSAIGLGVFQLLRYVIAIAEHLENNKP